METLILGSIVHYAIDTGLGVYVLPARVISFESDGKLSLRVFTDVNGSEWIVSADRSALKLPGTWHFRGE